MTPVTYLCLEHQSESLFKDRGSKFLGFAYPVFSPEEIKRILKKLKEEHPKAVHFCYAYRLGQDENNFRANDDGEPSGSAGKPILGVIDHFKLRNTLLVVVRYFGGVLLGVPGLINAYKMASHEAVQANKIIERKIEKKLSLQFDYTLMNDVMRVVKQFQCHIIKQELLLFCELELSIWISDYEKAYEKFHSLYGVRCMLDESKL